MKKYKIIYADPPWSYPESGSRAKVHGKHYGMMPLQAICDLPVKEITDEDCVLFLWVTMPRLFEAKEVIRDWGFEYKTMAFTWIKENRRQANNPMFGGKIDDFLGLGSWTRSNAELCLLAIKGKPKRVSASIRQLIVTPIEAHSKKPEEARKRIVSLLGDIPRLELFARVKTEGWDVWGNELESDINLINNKI